jgi:prepilin-type N-terminal cleavage/methylation domain-containing protein
MNTPPLPRRRRRQAGFSIPELAVALAMVSVLLAAGISASHGAITATSSIVSRDTVDSGIARSMHKIEELLVSASEDSLEGVPNGAGGGYGVPEPMQDGVDYSDVRFRSIVGFAAGAVVTDPPAGSAPRRFWRSTTGTTAGTLWFDNGKGALELLNGVTLLTFQRHGREIFLHMSVRGSGDGTVLTAENESTIRLLTP